jgi:hypothetical protein
LSHAPPDGHAFGLDLRLHTAAALPVAAATGTDRTCVVEEGPMGPLAPDASVLHEVHDSGGWGLRYVHHAEGLRIEARELGAVEVREGGRRLRCAPAPGVAAWSWQRLLVSQALPLAAAEQGLEPLHASAIAIDGRAVAITGPSGMGKTTLALALRCRGHALLADDVVSCASEVDGITAHAGAGVLGLRGNARVLAEQLIERGEAALLGTEDKTYVSVVPTVSAAPLEALVELELGPPGAASEIVPVVPAFGTLLEMAFDQLPRDAARHRRQLDTLAAVGERVPCYRLRAEPDDDAETLATAIERFFG